MTRLLTAGLVFVICAAVSAQMSVTQSADTTTVTNGNSISCNTAGVHMDNSYGRTYAASDFGAGSINITSITYGIESAISSSGTGQPVEIRIYDDPTGTALAPSAFAGLTQLCAEGPFNTADQALSVLTQPFAGACTVDLGAIGRLVVEIFTPDATATGDMFLIGSNPNGETNPSFFAAADCSVPDFVTLTSIGVISMHIVEVVNYDAVCPGTETMFGDDLTQTVTINAAVQAGNLHSLSGGDMVTITTNSPGGTYNGLVSAFLAEAYFTGSPPVGPVGGTIGICVTGSEPQTILVKPPVPLMPAGDSVSFTYPGGLSGVSFVSQALIPTALGGNGIFVTNDPQSFNLL